jgi:choline dehydrogenase-like flavoprotein
MNLNLKAKQNNTYDAIVVGSGITGGWAAKELCEKGLKTLVLERGREVKHIDDYTTAEADTWDLPNRGQIATEEVEKHYFKQIRSGLLSEANKHFFVKDDEHPYVEKGRLDWFRGYQLGGSSITWDRHAYRFSDLDFEANARDGIAIDWPLRYKDLAPWYSYVEKFIGVSGADAPLKHVPDAELMDAMGFNCVESHMKKQVEGRWNDRHVMVNKVANLTQYYELYQSGKPNPGGRQRCMMRNRCDRGCPYGGYFSSLSSTLPAALATGNLTIGTGKIVAEVIFNEDTQRAEGVRVVDAVTKQEEVYYARVVFLCAATVNSTSILMNSKSGRFPNGMGNDCGELGHNLMDHHLGVGLIGSTDDFERFYYKGRRPSGVTIPRFQNTSDKDKNSSFLRGFSLEGRADRSGWGIDFKEVIANGVGESTKKRMLRPPSDWNINLFGVGEMLPHHQNAFTLDSQNTDAWDMPVPVFAASYFSENEVEMRKAMLEETKEVFEECRFRVKVVLNEPPSLGRASRLMGTARMGKSNKSAVCNEHNQIHGCNNVYLTDGACMVSSGNQSPDLTLMALTCRAVDHAVKELNKQNL